MRAAVLASLAFALTPGLDQAGEASGPVVLHRLTDEATITFATRFLYKHHPQAVNWSFTKRYREESWTQIARDQIYAAEPDIGGDSPVLVLVVDNPNWCEADGCLGDIFRKTPKGYELICEAPLPSPEMPLLSILPAIENGYHDLVTADHTILWNERQDFDSGRLCAVESRAN